MSRLRGHSSEHAFDETGSDGFGQVTAKQSGEGLHIGGDHVFGPSTSGPQQDALRLSSKINCPPKQADDLLGPFRVNFRLFGLLNGDIQGSSTQSRTQHGRGKKTA